MDYTWYKKIKRVPPFPFLRSLFWRMERIVDLLGHDARYNLQNRGGERHILILRHLKSIHTRYNNHFLDWVRENHPDAARQFRLARLTRFPLNLKNTVLLVPWLQDPLKERFPREYAKALLWEKRCRARHIPVVNPVASLSNSIKSHALDVFAREGVRTIKTAIVTDPRTFDPGGHGLSFPICIRENIIHTQPMILVRNTEELKKVNWADFSNPVAVEFVDVQDPDGYYRKYRCLMAGPVCLPRHLIIAKKWNIHADDRIVSETNRREELAYMELPEDPNTATFNRLREALGFDTMAFDYSYDHNNELVVWEPNPFPVLWIDAAPGQEESQAYQIPTIERLYKMLLDFYLEKAGLGL